MIKTTCSVLLHKNKRTIITTFLNVVVCAVTTYSYLKMARLSGTPRILSVFLLFLSKNEFLYLLVLL